MRAGLLAVHILTYASNPLRDSAPALLETPDEPALRAFSCVAASEDAACSLQRISQPDANEDFTAPPHPDRVDDGPDPAAEDSARYHAAKLRAFIETLAGQPTARVIDVVAGFRFPTAADPFPASFYLHPGAIPELDRRYGTTNGTVWLGRGSVRDFAYDGDLVAHEMTHAMLDGVLPSAGFRIGPLGASVEPEAMNEALADYFAAALTNDPILDEWASAEPGAESGLRDLTRFASCPAAIDGLSHDEALLLSGALWSVRTARGASFDADVYRAIASLPRRADVGFRDLANAMTGDAKTALLTELDRRNVGCDPIFDVSSPLRAIGAGYYAPAASPGVVQMRLALPAGTTSLNVELTPIAVTPSLFAAPTAPFAPAIAAAWDAPVRGTPPAVALEGDALARATIPVPAGAHVAYLEVVNRGETDGLYNYVTVTPVSDPGRPAVAPSFAASGSGCGVGGGARHREPEDAAVLILAILTAVRSRGGTARRRS